MWRGDQWPGWRQGRTAAFSQGLRCADKGSFLEDFFGKTSEMGAGERGAYLETPPAGAPDIDEAHEVTRGPSLHLTVR